MSTLQERHDLKYPYVDVPFALQKAIRSNWTKAVRKWMKDVPEKHEGISDLTFNPMTSELSWKIWGEPQEMTATVEYLVRKSDGAFNTSGVFYFIRNGLKGEYRPEFVKGDGLDSRAVLKELSKLFEDYLFWVELGLDSLVRAPNAAHWMRARRSSQEGLRRHSLRASLIKLGKQIPELRAHLRPILASNRTAMIKDQDSYDKILDVMYWPLSDMLLSFLVQLKGGRALSPKQKFVVDQYYEGVYHIRPDLVFVPELTSKKMKSGEFVHTYDAAHKETKTKDIFRIWVEIISGPNQGRGSYDEFYDPRYEDYIPTYTLCFYDNTGPVEKYFSGDMPIQKDVGSKAALEVAKTTILSVFKTGNMPSWLKRGYTSPNQRTDRVDRRDQPEIPNLMSKIKENTKRIMEEERAQIEVYTLPMVKSLGRSLAPLLKGKVKVKFSADETGRLDFFVDGDQKRIAHFWLKNWGSVENPRFNPVVLRRHSNDNNGHQYHGRDWQWKGAKPTRAENAAFKTEALNYILQRLESIHRVYVYDLSRGLPNF